jgi:hypothetical protein
MNFDGMKLSSEEYSIDFYIQFLHYVKLVYAGSYYHATPSEIAAYVKQTRPQSQPSKS